MRLYRAIIAFRLGARQVAKDELVWLWPSEAQYLHVVPADTRPPRRKGAKR
jgi:hypothetical protein